MQSKWVWLSIICTSLTIASNESAACASDRIVVGPEVRLGGDPNRSQWEASLVVSQADPKRLLVSCILDPAKESKDKHTCATFFSADGGLSWQHHEFPREGQFDPVVAVGLKDTAYLVFLQHLRDPVRPSTPVTLCRSDDGGRTWGRPVLVSPKGDNADHPMIAVDHSGQRFNGRITSAPTT